MRILGKALCLWWLCGSWLEAGATIYVCTDRRGHQSFTDRGCPSNTLYTPAPAEPIIFTPLNEQESKQLKALAHDTETARQARQKAKQRRHKQLATAKNARQASCQQARAALKALARKRRKGYPLTAQQSLDTAQRSWQNAKRESCGRRPLIQ